ncbi:hypothetical protein CRG98_007951 [Punica granatum]|uniref:Uncharacterized protein n=1 Tax=Punica granatum TaxID=22663 RepID=A0A2I0KT24_PUNGR|nr:hypothetical protein CRG98_007951 [Punica granatum]
MKEKAIESTPSDPGARPWQSYNTVYTNAKAGMEGVDKEKVQRVVYEMSKGSKYFENEARKEAEMRQKIERMRAQCEKLSAAELAHFQMVILLSFVNYVLSSVYLFRAFRRSTVATFSLFRLR